MQTKMVRISEAAHRQLLQMARRRKSTISATVEGLVSASSRKQFWDEVDAAYERIWADPKASAEELAERRLYDNTLADGLKDDPWAPSSRAAKFGTPTSAKRSGMNKRVTARR